MIRKDQQGQGRWQAVTAADCGEIEGSNHANVVTNPHTWRFSAVAYGCRDCLPLLATIAAIVCDFQVHVESSIKSTTASPTLAMSVIYKNSMNVIGKFVPEKLQPLWKHPAG